MKIGFSLIGITAGAALGYFLNPESIFAEWVTIVADIALRTGKYFLIPMIFFSLPIAVTNLRRMKILGPVLYKTGLTALAAAGGLSLLSTLFVWGVDGGRLPVVPGNRPDLTLLPFQDIVNRVIPENSFSVFMGPATFLLPLVVLAFILGWHFFHDKEVAEPAYNVFDSLSRIFYRAGRCLLNLFPILLALITAKHILEYKRIADFSRFLPLLGTAAGMAIVVIGGIYPLVLRTAGKVRNPWKLLFRTSGILVGALVSASPLFNYGNFTVQVKEKLGIKRHFSASMLPILLMFSRAGTAMITTLCMLTVIRSYSSLEVTYFQAIWTAFFSFLLSFSIPTAPDRGLTASMMMLGTLYGRGLTDGWLILIPALPILSMITAVLDAATSGFVLLLVTRRTGRRAEHPPLIAD